jgi:DNA-binding transcriptional LysR family regulator
MAHRGPIPEKYEFLLKELNTLLRLDVDPGIKFTAGDDNMRQASRYLKHLEDTFECDFRKPGSRPVELTDEGHELANIIREYFQALESFDKKCAKQPTKIAIAAGDSVMNWVVLPALKSFVGEQKYLFSVRMGGTTGLIKLLRSSIIDFAIIPKEAKLKSDWKSATIGDYEYCICCSKMLLGNNDLTEGQLTNINFALITNHWNLDFPEMFASAGIEPKVLITCETFTHVASLIKNASFAGILPLSTMSSFPQESFSWFKPKFMKTTSRTLNLVWNSDGTHRRKAIDELSGPLLKKIQQELRERQAIINNEN